MIFSVRNTKNEKNVAPENTTSAALWTVFNTFSRKISLSMMENASGSTFK